MSLIYVHGFNSSERSYKAQVVESAMRSIGRSEDFICPRLSWQPKVAIEQLESLIEKRLDSGNLVGLVGSSLGGFYSAYLAEKYDLNAVLVNPAMDAPVLLQDYLGLQTNPYTNETYTLESGHMAELWDLDVPTPTGRKIWLMLQEGDEVLDYRVALERFPHVARLTHEQGGDHSFVDFARFVDDILAFTGFYRFNEIDRK